MHQQARYVGLCPPDPSHFKSRHTRYPGARIQSGTTDSKMYATCVHPINKVHSHTCRYPCNDQLDEHCQDSWHRDHCKTTYMYRATAASSILHLAAFLRTLQIIHSLCCGAGQHDALVTLPSSCMPGKQQIWTGNVIRAQKQYPLQLHGYEHPIPKHTTVVMAHVEQHYTHLVTHNTQTQGIPCTQVYYC